MRERGRESVRARLKGYDEALRMGKIVLQRFCAGFSADLSMTLWKGRTVEPKTFDGGYQGESFATTEDMIYVLVPGGIVSQSGEDLGDIYGS